MPGLLDEIMAKLQVAAPSERQAVEESCLAVVEGWSWVPNPGPQMLAYFSQADELGYGGEPGGGKSDLGIGLSITAHQRSLVLRRTNKEADKLVDRYEEILGTRKGYNSQDGVWRYRGRIIDIGGCQLEQDKQKRKGIPHDLKFFDQLEDFTESIYTFITTWTRSTSPGQRTRIVATFNPPTTPEGMWIIKRWAAWLDPTHPNPAQSGELRWYVKTEGGGNEKEVDGVGPHIVEGEHEPVYAKSRTFIRAELIDNPDLSSQPDYQRTLDALPEELRVLRKGDFASGIQDQPNQCIPTEWVRLAQERWEATAPQGVPMCAMGVDASGGGKDPMIIAPRYDGWFPPLIKIPGKELPPDRLGAHSAGLVLSHRRDRAIVGVDMGGGYGGSIYEHLKTNDVEVMAHKGAESSVRRTKDHQYKFTNKRTEVYWKFREALDPGQPGGSPIFLCPDQRLFAQLVTPTFEVTPNGIKLQTKEDVMDRLGHSPDEADAVVISWSVGPTYVTHGQQWADEQRSKHGGRQKVAVMGRRPHK
jgi:hypothetical protein